VPKSLRKEDDTRYGFVEPGEGFDALEIPLNGAKKRYSQAPVDDGWILICGSFMYGGHGMIARMKGGILKLCRNDGTATYQIMGDKKGRSFISLANVTHALSKMLGA